MRSARSSSHGGAPASWAPAADVRRMLERLDPALERAVETGDPELREMALLLVGRGGKRLRPALVFTAARFGNAAADASDETLTSAAAAMELLHVASLYHDDVMDRAPTRRGGATVNERWGNERAALAGTYLFARACALLAALGDEANRLAADVTERLCTGQLHEVESAFDVELDEEDHLATLAQKTAALFELPCRLGGALAGAPAAHVDALAAYGHHLGLAFQIADDALDLGGDAARLGKATGTDLREGVYGLAVLRALRRPGTERLRALLEQARLADADVAEIVTLVRAAGTVDEALSLARDHADAASARLDGLPDTEARASLRALAAYVVGRSS